MRIAMGIASTLLTVGAMTAQASPATTYGLDLSIGSMNFDGTFDFSKTGNCTASSLLCDPGTKPDFSKVHISDGFNDNFFTQASLTKSQGGEHITFYDLNGLPDLSSQMVLLSFDINGKLGGPLDSFKLSNIVLNTNGNSTGMFQCGVNSKCTSSLKATSAVAAPEMDVTSAGSALGLILGSLAVIGGRRLRIRDR